MKKISKISLLFLGFFSFNQFAGASDILQQESVLPSDLLEELILEKLEELERPNLDIDLRREIRIEIEELEEILENSETGSVSQPCHGGDICR